MKPISLKSDSFSGRVQYHSDGRDHSHFWLRVMDWIGHKLTWPMSQTFAEFLLFSRALHPGECGQQKKKETELCIRVGHFFKMVVLGLIGFPLALIGGCLRCTATTNRKDFTFTRPQAIWEESPKGEIDIRLLTFNVGLGPECMMVHNKMRPSKVRVHEVAAAIHRGSFDIVCLQEAFHTEAEAILKDKLKKDGFQYFITTVGHSRFKVSSGLFLASRFRIENPAFWSNTPTGGSDDLASKGLLGVTVYVGQVSFALFTLHLNAGAPGGGERIRKLQILNILSHINEYVTRYGLGDRIILCGDFNIGPAEEDGERCDEWWRQEELFEKNFINFIDPKEKPTSYERNLDKNKKFQGTALHIGGITGWHKDLLSEWTVKQNRIDHILVARSWVESSTSKIIIPTSLEIDIMDGSSDHMGVIGTFGFAQTVAV